MNNTSVPRVKECFFKLKLQSGLAANTSFMNLKNKNVYKPIRKRKSKRKTSEETGCLHSSTFAYKRLHS